MSKTKKRLIITFSIIGVFVLLMIVFGALFSLKRINVDFATATNRVEAYEKEDIISASGIKKGKNIIFANYSKAEARLEKEFPYARFQIVRTFPNSVTIYVYERTPVIRVTSENGMWHIYDEDLKCLEIVAPTNISENNNDKVPIYNGDGLVLCSSEGEFMNNPTFSSKLTTIIDGVYGAGQTPINIMSDITLEYNEALGFEVLTFVVRANGAKIVVQGEDYQLEKIAYGVYVYLSDVSSNEAYYDKLDKVTIVILNNFNPNIADTKQPRVLVDE